MIFLNSDLGAETEALDSQSNTLNISPLLGRAANKFTQRACVGEEGICTVKYYTLNSVKESVSFYSQWGFKETFLKCSLNSPRRSLSLSYSGLRCLKPRPSSLSPQISLDRLYQSRFASVVRLPVPQQTISLIAFAKGSRVTSRYFLLLKPPTSAPRKRGAAFRYCQSSDTTTELKELSEAYLS